MKCFRWDHPLTSFPTRRGSRCLLAAWFLASFIACLLVVSDCRAAEINIPALHFDLNDPKAPQSISGALQIVFLITVMSLAPAVLVMMTSFTRLAVVFSFLRHALGTQQSPPNQIIIGLALFLTFFIMQPVWQSIHQEAIKPYQDHKISGEELLSNGAKPLKAFMLKQTRKADLALFVSLAQKEKPKDTESLSMSTIIPAFVISELKTAFQIGFMLYIPFIILDMVVSSILLSMGMMMLPPVMISLPFKLMLFVMVDGWNLLVGSLVKSFQ
ncbi:MAG: flagellar type III secretion system pore protein FliP [Deltaproteobacteria bacterium]|jgi:flagellar biosynthetic protein FliP|nr:flagellar type III secretion system pore protein FliP [Deltaproteobacteria bacterium]